MTHSTGDAILDGLVGGGVPTEGTLLVRGSSGTGRSRLATGALAAGDWYVSVGPPDRRRREALPGDVTTVVVSPTADGLAVEVGDDSTETTLAGLAGTLADVAGAVPDRVVLDGVEGLGDAGGGVVRLCSALEAAGAACLVTAAGDAPALTHHAAAVVECWQDPVGGDFQRFLRVEKAPTDLDSRRYRLALSATDAGLVPRSTASEHETLATDIEGFDELVGGFVRDGVTVFEHDARTSHWPFTASVCAHVLERGARVVCVTAPGVVAGRVNDLLASRIGSVQQLMKNDQFYLLDTVSQDRETGMLSGFPKRNVILQSETGSLQESIRSLVDRLAGRPTFAVLELSAVLHHVSPAQARQMFYWASANVIALPGFSAAITVDRSVAGDRVADFFTSEADTAFKTWRGEEGLDFFTVEKGPSDAVGRSRVVEPLAEPPFVRLR
ncbi:RAD55 family ATPase [Natronomonas sp. EA1]|uniref:RAD55 family ATPase n=1 Tax=Natronomonas sp. EA1 TaxID=3421655 RepID=UPI003EB6A153